MNAPISREAISSGPSASYDKEECAPASSSARDARNDGVATFDGRFCRSRVAFCAAAVTAARSTAADTSASADTTSSDSTSPSEDEESSASGELLKRSNL